jgi:hypothetical protein
MDFQDVKTYRDLQDSNILFLEGGLNRTPYHHGSVDPETIPLLNDLVNILGWKPFHKCIDSKLPVAVYIK